MKKYLAAPLILCSIALASGSVFAGANNPPQSVSSDSSSLITPMASEGYPGQTLSGQQMSYPFKVKKDMPYWRVWIQNTSNNDYKVTITKGSPTGYVEWSGTFPANKTGNITANHSDYDADTYYVNFTCGSCYLSGTVAARIASTYREIMP